MAGNIINPFEPLPEQPTLSINEASERLAESEKALHQQQQDLNKAYINELTKRNPEQEDLPLPVNGNYKQAELQLLKDIIGFRPQTKEQVLQYLDSNPLLSKLYEYNEGYKNAIADSVLRRSLELSNGQAPTYNELLGDVDPRTQIDYSNQGENPDSKFMQVVKNDILKPIDSFLHTDFMDKNKVARAKADSIERLSAFGKDTQTAVGKLRTLGELKRQANELAKRVTPFTEEGRQAELDLEAVQAKINSLALTDAEIAAYQKNGEAYLQEEARYNSIKDWERDVNPRYIEDVQNDIEDAEFNQYMNLKYGNNSVISNFKNMDYMKDFMGYAFDKVFGSKAKFINTLEELAPWMLLSIATGSAGTWGKLGQVALTVGSGTANIDTALDAYFQKYGTVEGFNKLQAFVGGGLNYLANMYGGHVTLRGIPSSTVNAIKGAINEEYGKTSAIIQKALNNVSDASIANSMVKAGLKNFSTFTLPSIVSRVGRNLESYGSKVSLNATKLGAEEATTKVGKIAETLANPKKAAGKMISGVGKALDSAVSKTVAGLVQGSIGGGASMALDNLTAEFATQLGNQTGYDADKALQSALEGIPVGMAGHLGGLGANVAGRVGSYIKNAIYDRWKPLHKYRLSNKDMAIEDKILSNKDFIGTEASINYLKERTTDLTNAIKDVTKVEKENEFAKDATSSNPAEQKEITKRRKKYTEANGLRTQLEERLKYLKNLKDESIKLYGENAKTTAEQVKAAAFAQENMSEEFAKEQYSNEAVQKAKMEQAEALKEEEEYTNDFGDEKVTKDFNALANHLDIDATDLHNFDKDSKFKSLVSEWNDATDETAKNNILNEISKHASEFKKANKDTLKKGDNAFLDNLIKRSSEEHRNKVKEGEYIRSTINKDNIEDFDKQEGLDKPENKAFNDLFNSAYKNDKKSGFMEDTILKDTFEANKDKYSSKEELKEAYDKYAKEKQAKIDLHNAQAESTNKKLYDSKEALKADAEGLTENEDYIINSVKDANGKEHYYVTKPEEKYSKLTSLLDSLSKDISSTIEDIKSNDTKHTLEGVDKEFNEVLKDINHVAGFKLESYDKLSIEQRQKFITKLRSIIDTANNKSKNYKKYIKEASKDKNIFVDSTYMQTGYSTVKAAVQLRNALEKARDFTKNEEEELNNLHLDKSLLSPDGALQKSLGIAFDRIGLSSKALLGSTSAKKMIDALNSSSIHLGETNIKQLEYIQRKLNSYMHMPQFYKGTMGKPALVSYKIAVDNLLTLLRDAKYKKSKNDLVDLWGSLTDAMSSNEARASQEEIHKSILAFNEKCAELGITKTTSGQESAAIDFSDVVEDVFNLRVSTNVISTKARSILSRFVGSKMSEVDALMPLIGDLIPADTIWNEFLHLRYKTESNELRYIWQDLRDSATDTGVKNFFSDKNNNNNERTNFKADFDSLASRDKSLQSRIINHLLTRKEVLASLGLIKVDKLSFIKDAPITTTYPEINAADLETGIRNLLNNTHLNVKDDARLRTALASTLILAIGKDTSISNVSSVNLINTLHAFVYEGLRSVLDTLHVNYPIKGKNKTEDLHVEKLFEKFDKENNKIIELFDSNDVNPDSIRKKLKNNSTLPDEVKDFIRNNYGKLYVYRKAKTLLDANNKDKSITLQQLGNYLDLLNFSIPVYNEFSFIDRDAVGAESFNSLKDILAAAGIEVDKVTNYIKQNTTIDGPDKDLWDKYIKDSKLAKNGFFNATTEPLTNVSEGDIKALAKMMAAYINAYSVHNTKTVSNNQTLNLPSNGAASAATRKRKFAIGAEYEKIFKKKIKSPLMQDDALSIIEQNNRNNPAVVELIKMIREAAFKAQDLFVVDSIKKHITSQLETIGDTYADHYVNVIATAALSSIPTISTELSEDFKKELMVRYPNVPQIVDYFTNNKCVDLNALATDLGKVCVAALGYDKTKNPTIYENAIVDTGMHCIALLHHLGYIEVGRIDRATGRYFKAEKGQDFKNSINVVTLTKDFDTIKDKITTYDKFDAGTHKESIMDNLLGFSNRDKDPYLEKSFEAIHGKKGKLSKEFDGHNNKELLKHDNGDGTTSRIMYDSDDGIIKYVETNNSNNSAIKEYYFRDVILHKKDGTDVTPLRLQQIISNMVRPPRLNIARMKQLMNGLIAANGDILLKESDYANDDAIKKAIKNSPTLGILIDYQDPYSRTGEYSEDLNTRNKENIKKLLRTLNWLSTNIYKNTAITPDTKSVPIYYDEENTVNNRFFVNNIALNYREDKILRNLFEMSEDSSNVVYTVNPKIKEDARTKTKSGWQVKRNDFTLPIFAGLDIGWDKMTSDGIEATKKSLLNSKAFKKLLKEFNADDPSTWEKSIKDFNDAKDVLVTAIKPGYGEGNTAEPKVLEIPYNHETIYTLIKLQEIKVSTTKGTFTVKDKPVTALKALFNPTGSISVSNYTLRIEIDGTTNGPAIRAMIGSLGAGGDTLESMLATGVGITPLFTNFVDILDNGFLDTYLISGAFAQYDVAQKALDNMLTHNFKTNKTTALLTAIYGKELGSTLVNTLRDIMTRNFMKYPVMYITYSAGMESVSLDFFKLINVQLSEVLAKKPGPTDEDKSYKAEEIKKILRMLVELNGGNPIRVTYDGKQCTLDAEGRIKGEARGNIVENEIDRRKVTIKLEDTLAIKKQLRDEVLDPIYLATSKAMEDGQKILNMNNLATNQHAYAFNVVLEKKIRDIVEAHPNMTSIDMSKYVNQITDELFQIFTPIIAIEDEVDNGLSGSTLNTFKAAIGRDVDTRFRAMTLLDPEKSTLILSNKYKSPYREGLGAGQSPMTAHSVDSFNMTNFQEFLIRKGFGKGLPIHDAMISDLKQLGAIQYLNKIFYKDKIKIAEICVARDNSLQNAMDWIEISDLPSDIKQQLLSQYAYTLSQTRMSTQVDVLYRGKSQVVKMLDVYKKNKNNGSFDSSTNTDLIHINQFSLDKDSAYTPTEADLKAESKKYDELIEKSEMGAYGLKAFVDTLNSEGENNLYSILNSTNLSEETKKKYMQMLTVTSGSNKGKLKKEYIGTSIKDTIKKISTDINDAVVEQALKDAETEIIANYKSKDPLNRVSVVNTIKKDSKDVVDLEKVNTNLKSDFTTITKDNAPNLEAKVQAIKAIAQAINFLTEKIDGVSFHKNDFYIQECLHKAIIANKTIFAKNTITAADILTIAQDAVGISLGRKVSYEQRLAYDEITSNITLLQDHPVQLKQFDKTLPTYIDYTDDLDYEAIESYIEANVNKNNVQAEGYKNANYQSIKYATADWFNTNIVEKVRDKYDSLIKINPKAQIVFTLRSKGDELRMKALQYLKDTNDAYKNISIAIVPAITDKTDTAPKVDKEVNMYWQLKNILGDRLQEVIYNKGTVSNSNVRLIEAITDKTISENAIVSGIDNRRAGAFVVDDSTESDQYIERVQLKSDKYTINFTDEIGELRQTSTQNDSSLPEIARSFSGIRNRSLQDIDLSNVINASEEDLNSRISTGFSTKNLGNMNTYTVKNGDLQSIFTYDRTGDASNDNRALVINLCADGSPVANNLKLLDLDDLKNSLHQVQSSMRADYAKYLRGDITWKDYLKPRVIKATDSTGVTRHYVFQVTVDSSVTKADLFDAVQTEQRGAYTAPKEIVRASALGQWLNTRASNFNVNDTYNFIKRNASDSAETGDKRIPIPRYLLDESVLEINNYQPELNTFNGCCLEEIQKELSLNGVDTLTFVHQTSVSGEYILPNNSNFDYNSLVLSGLNYHTAPDLSSDINKARFNIKDAYISAKNAILSPFIRNKHVKSQAYKDSLNNEGVRNMRGYSNANTVNEQAGEMLNGEVAFRGALDICKQSDASRGVDTADSDLGWLDDLMIKSSTPIALYVKENSNTIGDSQVALLRDKTTGIAVREQITLGRANRGESQTESFRHEYAHTVWRHASPRERQELQKVFNTFVDNYQMSDFADGDTIANRQIIDAFTNEKTPDRLEEFGAYMVSNTALRQAVRNMQQRVGKTKIKENLIERISNIFKDIINKVMSFVSGSYSPKSSAEFKDLVKSVDDIFQSSYKSSAKFWQEAQQGIDVTVPDQFSGTTEGWDINVQRGFEAARQQNQKTRNMLPDRLRYLLNVDSAAFASEKGEQDLTQTLVDHARLFTDDRDSFFKEFASDILGNIEGASPDLYKYLSIRNKGKMLIDQQRERSAASVNEVVREILKDVPKEVESKLSDYFVKADISCLFNSTKSPEEVSKLLTDKSARDKEIKQLTNTIKGQRFADAYINMAKGLASYLVTGFNPTGLAYRNAYEIVQLSGSSYQQATDANGPIVRAVDQLVTLYAVDMLNQKDPTVYNSLDSKVIDRLSTLHNGIKSAEAEMVYGNSEQRYHIPKGQIHGGKTTGRYDIIPQSELKAYEWNGYEKVEDAKLDPFYSKVAKEKYVIVKAKWKSPTPFTAGVTIMTDIFLGRAKSGLSYNGEGRVDKDIDFKRTNEFKQLKDYVNLRVNALNKSNPQLIKDAPHGNLVLNFNAYGDLTGANYELNPKVTDEMIGRNTKITAVFGDLYGSAVERSASPEYNKKAGEALIEIYENQKNKNPNDFIWISDSSENEDYRNMYDKLPYDTKQVCEEKYGDKGIPVMKKAINTVFGYKQISANDIEATKELNMFKDEVSKSFLDYAKWIFHSGISGNMEEFFKWLASTAKDNIVIKGITTSWNNLISNCTTLGVHGLSLKNVAKYQAEAFMAMRAINEWEKQLSALNTKKLLGTYNNNDAIKERTLKTNIEKSPLYPLYKRGIVSNSLAENEVESDKLLKDTIDKVLPKGPWRDFAHEMTLSPKGNLYQALFLFASAGDTVAKYSLYKDLRQRGASEEEACRQALETFIDYSNPLPRSIQYLDSLGIYPFAKYALGSKSSIINSLAKHSDRALGFIAANSLLLGLPNIYEGLFGTTTLLNKFNLPGELFVDSLNGLMSVRITNTLMDSL